MGFRWSGAAAAVAVGAMLGAAAEAMAQPASEGHPHKWQTTEKSLYDLVAEGYKLVTAVYEASRAGGETDPDVHYFLQKDKTVARCDFRKRGETSFYWCYHLAKPNTP